jgi:hypothetical protein
MLLAIMTLSPEAKRRPRCVRSKPNVTIERAFQKLSMNPNLVQRLEPNLVGHAAQTPALAYQAGIWPVAIGFNPTLVQSRTGRRESGVGQH